MKAVIADQVHLARRQRQIASLTFADSPSIEARALSAFFCAGTFTVGLAGAMVITQRCKELVRRRLLCCFVDGM